MLREYRREEVRESTGQMANPGKGHENSQNSRQEIRSENKITDQKASEAQPKQRLVRQNVGRGRRGVVINHQPAKYRDGEHRRYDGKQVKDARNPGLELRRRFSGPFHYTYAHTSPLPVLKCRLSLQ